MASEPWRDELRWPRGTPVGPGGHGPGGGRWMHALDTALALLGGHRQSRVTAEAPLRGGNSGAAVSRITYADGTWAVRKRFTGSDILQRDPRQLADSEELASIVGAHLGVAVPQVVRTAPDEVVMRGIDGQAGYDWVAQHYPVRGGGYDPRAFQADIRAGKSSPSQRRLAVFDVLLDNHDRTNPGNWFVTPQGLTVGIDHAGVEWGQGDRGPQIPHNLGDPGIFAAGWTRGFEDPKWRSNPLTKADVQWLRVRLDGVRPEFERLGRLDWWQSMSARFEAVAAHAKGTPDQDIFDHQDVVTRHGPVAGVDWGANQAAGAAWAARLVGRLHHGLYQPGQWQRVDPAQHLQERKDRAVTLFIGDGMSVEQAHAMADRMFADVQPPQAVYANGPHEIVFEHGTDSPRQQVVDYLDRLMAVNPPNGPVRVAVVPSSTPYFQREGGITTRPANFDGKAPWAVVHLNDAIFTDPQAWEPHDWTGLPAAAEVPFWQYIVAHEWGHVMAEGVTAKPLFHQYHDMLSPYGRGHVAEAAAEMFAEWWLAGGYSTNELANRYANWYRWGRKL